MSKRVTRKDYAWEPLALPQKTGSGLMRVEGYVTSSGVFPYEQEDGTVLREYRPPEEVDEATSIDSLRLAPVTIGHPADPVTVDNFKELSVGTLGDRINSETEWPKPDVAGNVKGERKVRLRAAMLLADAKAIKIIEDKELPEVSCGYTADLEMSPGITPDGEPYDAVQRRIVYNHVAIGVVGRHGPGVAIRVDGKTPPTPPQETPPMKKLILDGVSYDAPEQTIEAVAAHQRKSEQKLADAVDALAKKNDEVVDLNKKLAEAEQRADAASKAEKAAQKAAEEERAKISQGVKERRQLERAAIKVMGDEAFEAANLSDADDDDVRVAVIKHVNPDLDITDRVAAAKKGDAGARAYIGARFDVVVESASRTDGGDVVDDEPATKADGKRADSAGSLRGKTVVAAAHGDAADKARADRVAYVQGAHKTRKAG